MFDLVLDFLNAHQFTETVRCLKEEYIKQSRFGNKEYINPQRSGLEALLAGQKYSATRSSESFSFFKKGKDDSQLTRREAHMRKIFKLSNSMKYNPLLKRPPNLPKSLPCTPDYKFQNLAAQIPDIDDEWEDDDDPGYRRFPVPEIILSDIFYDNPSSQYRKTSTKKPSSKASSSDFKSLTPAENPPSKSSSKSDDDAKSGSDSAKAKAGKEEKAGSEGDKQAKPVDDDIKYDSFNLKVVYVKGRTGFEETKDFPIQINSVIAGRYLIQEYLGSAAFSKAIACADLARGGQQVCIKIINNNKDFLDQSFDEIKLLMYINSMCNPDEKHVLRLIDYFYHKEHLFIVTELLRDNLYEFYKYNRESGDDLYFTIPRLKRIAKQILTALEFIHGLNLIHCDLKPENILIKSYSRCEVKVIDFGSSCFTHDHLSSYVQSRAYRAPEVILGLPYDQKIDIWSLGCILFELYTGNVLFHNDSISSLLARINGIIGNFPRKMLQAGRYARRYYSKTGVLYDKQENDINYMYLRPKRTTLRHRLKCRDEQFVDFLAHLLKLDPQERPTATQALKHPWLR